MVSLVMAFGNAKMGGEGDVIPSSSNAASSRSTLRQGRSRLSSEMHRHAPPTVHSNPPGMIEVISKSSNRFLTTGSEAITLRGRTPAHKNHVSPEIC